MVWGTEKSPPPGNQTQIPGCPTCIPVTVLSSKYWTVFRQEFFKGKNHLIYARKRKSPSMEVYRFVLKVCY
jgi:hypothetical protein